MLHMQQMLFMAVVAVVQHKKNISVLNEVKKKTIFFSFDDDLLLESKRILFQKRASLQQFFSFILYKVVQRHEDVDKLFLEFSEYLNKQALSKEKKEEILKISAENLYSMFEEEDKKRGL